MYDPMVAELKNLQKKMEDTDNDITQQKKTSCRVSEAAGRTARRNRGSAKTKRISPRSIKKSRKDN